MEEFVGLCTKLVGDRVWVGNLRIIKETKKGNWGNGGDLVDPWEI